MAWSIAGRGHWAVELLITNAEHRPKAAQCKNKASLPLELQTFRNCHRDRILLIDTINIPSSTCCAFTRDTHAISCIPPSQLVSLVSPCCHCGCTCCGFSFFMIEVAVVVGCGCCGSAGSGRGWFCSCRCCCCCGFCCGFCCCCLSVVFSGHMIKVYHVLV